MSHDTTTTGGTWSAVVPGPRGVPDCERHCTPTTPTTPTAPLLAGHAWLLRDVTHVPGVLSLRDGRLRFVSTRRTVLDATPRELELTLPRTRRGPFGLILDGDHLGLAVLRPSGAVAVPADLLDREGGADPTVGDAEAAARWYHLLAPLAVGRPRPVRRALSALAPVRGVRAPASSPPVHRGSAVRTV